MFLSKQRIKLLYLDYCSLWQAEAQKRFVKRRLKQKEHCHIYLANYIDISNFLPRCDYAVYHQTVLF